MDILNSDWLIYMLKKSSKTPQGRLLSLFDILGDWLTAPNVAEDLAKLNDVSPIIYSKLADYLTQQAELAGAQEPAMLTHQLYFMVNAAIQESLRAANHLQLSTDLSLNFTHAKNAAAAIISAQIKQNNYTKKFTLYTIAASMTVVSLLLGGLWLSNGWDTLIKKSPVATIIQKNSNLVSLNNKNTHTELIASPEQTATLFATLEQMRKGNCQFPEALQMPDSYKAIYIENIIGGNVSSKIADQKIIMQILQKVRCNYSPMLMENSRS